MKMFQVLFCVLILASCSETALQKDLEITKSALEAAENELVSLKTAENEKGNLCHLIYLKLKPDADTTLVFREIEQLREIKEIESLTFGTFKDLGDERALSDYQLVIEMSFKNEAAYQTYQTHKLHTALKKNTKSQLAGPPATYDFIKK